MCSEHVGTAVTLYTHIQDVPNLDVLPFNLIESFYVLTFKIMGFDIGRNLHKCTLISIKIVFIKFFIYIVWDL
jgi:hypothetical protein